MQALSPLMGLIPVIAHTDIHHQRHCQLRDAGHVCANSLLGFFQNIRMHFEYEFVVIQG